MIMIDMDFIVIGVFLSNEGEYMIKDLNLCYDITMGNRILSSVWEYKQTI